MSRQIIFISSVQKEFAEERKALAAYIREDDLMKLFFDAYLFEEIAANGDAPGDVYLEEVKGSAIYAGLLGVEYGYENADGVSPTELEFDTARSESKPCWIFIKGGYDVERHPKEDAFISKVGELVSRKRYGTLEELKKEVFKSCVLYLQQTGKLTAEAFDSSLHPTATLDDITDDTIVNFVRSARAKRNFPLKETATKEEVLTHLNLYRDGSLTYSALLAFGSDPQKSFPTATVKCAHFHGTTVEKPIPDYREYGGTVYEVADEAVDFVLSKISLSTGDRSESNEVQTTYEIPRAAIAEAIINAVAHRDYFSKSSIQVSVFKDRVEVSNPGHLPPELDIAALREPHSSYPHNPLLAQCMFLTGMIERYGTGTIDIVNLTEDRGLRSPDFLDEHIFSVTLWRPSAATGQVTGQVAAHDGGQVIGQVTGQVAGQVAGQVTGQVTGQVQYFNELKEPERVVLVIEGEMKRDLLMEMLELKHRDHFMDNYLKPAMKEGWVERTIPDKPTSSKQKYRLTEAGLIHKEKLVNGSK